MVNTKGIKVFLHDVKAVSPAIATLILIVIAAVAAAGVGILVQSSQKNAQDQTANKNLDVVGEFSIKGSTTVLPVSQGEISAFQKLYPAVTINLGGGGSSTGRALVFNKQVDVGASSDVWPTGSTTTDSTTGLSYDGREDAVIQAAGVNAFLYETKIGTGMIVVAANLGSTVTSINITNGVADSSTIGVPAAQIAFADLYDLYANTTCRTTNPLCGILTAVQRNDESGTEDTFAAWIGLQDGTSKQLLSTVNATGAQGNQGIRDYISTHSKSIGFVDIGFATGGINGIANVMPASQNSIVASKTTKGFEGPYSVASNTVNGGTSSKTLARDLYYYSQGIPTGAQKAFFDFVLSNDGQTIVEQTGFYRP